LTIVTFGWRCRELDTQGEMSEEDPLGVCQGHYEEFCPLVPSLKRMLGLWVGGLA